MSLFSRSLFLFSVFLLCGSLLAQSLDRAEVSGRVTDESGAAVPGVDLQLVNIDTGHEFQARSTETGDFVFPFVAAGEYELTAEKDGFRKLTMDSIRLSVSQRLSVPLTLPIGSLKEEIVVSNRTNQIEATTATVRHLITHEEIEDLPLMLGDSGRSVQTSLMLLTPGASYRDEMGFQGERVISINGSPNAGVGFSVDGVDNTAVAHAGGGPISSGPNPDAIKEFSVVRHSFRAEHGSYPVQVQLRTRNGTNTWHGQLRAIHLNPDLTARDFFARGKGTASTNSAGGFQLSGPLTIPGVYSGHDRTFFFFDGEITRSRLAFGGIGYTVSENHRRGDFSDLDPGLWPIDPETGEVFPGGIIPKDRILPQSLLYMDEVIPRPDEGNIWYIDLADTSRGTQTTTRIDHQLPTQGMLNASWFLSDTYYGGPFYSTPSTVWEFPYNSDNVAVNYTESLTPKITNSFAVGWSRGVFDQRSVGKFNQVDLREKGFNITQDPDSPGGYPQVWLSDTEYFDPGGMTFKVVDTSWSVKNDLSIVRNRHALKMGAEFRWLPSSNYDSWSGAPWSEFASYNPYGTGNDVGDFLLGKLAGYWQASVIESAPRRTLSGMFFQDDWKVRANLTLNLGLRYEIAGVWSVEEGRNVVFRPGGQSRTFPGAPEGLLYQGDVDPLTGEEITSALNPSDHDNWAPRLGFAYSPDFSSGWLGSLFGGPGNSSIRGGFGIFYVASRGTQIGQIPFVQPWFMQSYRGLFQISEAGGNFLDPWGAAGDPFQQAHGEREFVLPVSGISSVEPSFSEGYQQQWSLSFQRQLPSNVAVEVAYLGSRSVHLPRRYEMNPGQLTENARPGNENSRRLFPGFTSIEGYASDGSASYNAMEIRVERRFASDFQINAHYTWSKNLDNTSPAGTFLYDLGDRDATPWARSSADRRHQLVAYSLWDLPDLKRWGVAGKLLSDWKLSGILQLRSGMPLNIRNAVDPTLRGVSLGFPDITGEFISLDPREVRTFTLPNGRTVTGNFLFDPTVFSSIIPSSPEEARQGNLGRNVFDGPGVENVDLSLMRYFRIGERHRIDFRVDMTNAFNHAQFRLAGRRAVYTNNFRFGQTTRTSGPRRIQFFIRYSF